MKVLSRLSGEKMMGLLQIFVLLGSESNKRLYNLEAFRKLYNTGVEEESISMPMKFESVFRDTIEGLKSSTFYMKDAKAVLKNQLRPATEGQVQMKHTILDWMDTVSTSKENAEHPMRSAYVLSVYSFVKGNGLR